MARTVHQPIPQAIPMNTGIQTAKQVADKLNVDPAAVDKVVQQLGVDLIKNPAVLNYFRTIASSLNVLTDRSWEIDIKALAAQLPSPQLFKNVHFDSRDTSKGALFQDRLPDNFITPGTLNQAAKTGLLTPKQADAIKLLFGFTQPPPVTYTKSYQQQGQGGFGQLGQQGTQGASPEENDWAAQLGGDDPFSTGQGDEAASGTGGTLQQGITGPGSTGGTLRQGMGGGPGAPPPPGATSPGASSLPPPPPGTSGAPLGGESDGYQSLVQNPTQGEQDSLDSSFSPDDPVHGLLQDTLNSEGKARSAEASLLNDIQSTHFSKQQILADLGNLDMNNPKDAAKIAILQSKLGDINSSEQQLLSDMSLLQQKVNERKEYTKSILDIMFQTSSAIIRNLRQ
jgi:hypothetical protein